VGIFSQNEGDASLTSPSRECSRSGDSFWVVSVELAATLARSVYASVPDWLGVILAMA
jgi:hypothetical protein